MSALIAWLYFLRDEVDTMSYKEDKVKNLADGWYLARTDDMDDEPCKIEVKDGRAFKDGVDTVFIGYEFQEI